MVVYRSVTSCPSACSADILPSASLTKQRRMKSFADKRVSARCLFRFLSRIKPTIVGDIWPDRLLKENRTLKNSFYLSKTLHSLQPTQWDSGIDRCRYGEWAFSAQHLICSDTTGIRDIEYPLWSEASEPLPYSPYIHLVCVFFSFQYFRSGVIRCSSIFHWGFTLNRSMIIDLLTDTRQMQMLKFFVRSKVAEKNLIPFQTCFMIIFYRIFEQNVFRSETYSVQR